MGKGVDTIDAVLQAHTTETLAVSAPLYTPGKPFKSGTSPKADGKPRGIVLPRQR
ncbi:MAG: hypothetical protein M3037_02855 [Gemmatimonadota bacterium]|nr:hypothetical protein [Gemmatimonadota bacterium]